MKTSARQPKRSKRAAPRVRAAHLGPERRRPQVLDVAFELFLARGYKGTSVQDIAQAAGVTKPVIYACFASKAELFGALLDREEQRMFAQFGAALTAGAQPGDVEATLTAGFTSMLQAVLDTPEAYRIALLGGGGAEDLIETRVRRGRERQIAAIASVAREWLGASRGEDVSPRYLDAAAQFVGQTLLSIGEAGVRMLLTTPAQWTPETLGPSLAKLAAGGYAALAGRG
jgi:AcrR family transcriptional regulator